jgi:hypothetical protein
MTISMYTAAVVPVRRGLGSLLTLVNKAEEFCVARKIDQEVLINSRLYPDMLPLSFQIRSPTDHGRRLVALLSGNEFPAVENTEKTFAAFKDRVSQSIEYIDSFKPEQIDGTEDKEVLVKFPSVTLPFKGYDFAMSFSVPNFYFHLTTTYAMLRQIGVELSKKDFIG